MKRIIKFILKFVIIVVVLVLLLLTTATIILNTQSVQDDLAKYATEQLELKLPRRLFWMVWRLKTYSIGRCSNWVAYWWMWTY